MLPQNEATSRPWSLKDDNNGNPGTDLVKYNNLLGLNDFNSAAQPYVNGDVNLFTCVDNFDRVTMKEWWSDDGTKLARTSHTYDRAGNRLSRTDARASQLSKHLDELYSYDGVNRLTERKLGNLNASNSDIVAGTLSKVERFTLDPLGNWTDFLQDADDATPYDLDQSRSHNKANELIQIDSSSTHVAHDAVGNMTTMPKPTDFAAHYTCTYDAWNRLVKVADGATTVAEYEYDGMHHRTVKKTYVSGTLDETRHYYYDKDWRCLEERVGTNTDAERRYVWGPGARAGDWESENPLGKFFQIAASLPSVSPTRTRYIDELICRDRMITESETTTTERLWAMLDANYNVVGLLEMSGWHVRERYTYDAYGQVEVRDANS